MFHDSSTIRNAIRSAAWRCRLLIVAFGKCYCHAKVDTVRPKAESWKCNEMVHGLMISILSLCPPPGVPHTSYNKWNETILTQLNRQEIMAHLFSSAVTRRISHSSSCFRTWVKFVQLPLLSEFIYLLPQSFSSSSLAVILQFFFPQRHAIMRSLSPQRIFYGCFRGT